MCFFSSKHKFLLLFMRTEAIHQDRSWSSGALQHPHGYVRHEYVNLGHYTDTPSTLPAHCTDCLHSRALNHISAAGRSHPRTLPGGGAVAQGWASLLALCPAVCPSLVQMVQFAKKHIRVMLGSCNSVQGPQHLWYTAYRHSFTR